MILSGRRTSTGTAPSDGWAPSQAEPPAFPGSWPRCCCRISCRTRLEHGSRHRLRQTPGVPAARTPPLAVVKAVVTALQAHGAEAAVGGSGLLAALGLVDSVRDWDVTTDAATGTVELALAAVPGAPVTAASAGEDDFATRARFLVHGEDHAVDVLVGFALLEHEHFVPLPTRVTRTWRGLPIGDPAVWLRAYRLLGRHERADLLQRWLDVDQHPVAVPMTERQAGRWRGICCADLIPCSGERDRPAAPSRRRGST